MKKQYLKEILVDEYADLPEPMLVNKTLNVWEKNDGGLKESRFKSKKKRGDCVIRAIALATDISYDKVFDDLCDVAKETGFLPNQEETFEPYLASLGWRKNKPQRMGRCLVPLEMFNSRGKTSIVRVRRHLVTVKDNLILDTYDTKFYSACSYYTKETTQ
jgi:hypothetical protein